MKPELERDPIWRTIPCAKEILVTKGIASRAPWEMIQVILSSFGMEELGSKSIKIRIENRIDLKMSN